MARLAMLGQMIGSIKSKIPTIQTDSWRSDKQSSTARGYGYKWQQAREGYLAKHPLCVYCQAQDIIRPATIVDHKIPHRGDMKLFWDRDNWQGLCVPCHSSVKQREDNAG